MSEDQGLAVIPGAGDSAGARIRRAREQAGLHIAALAVALKVPVRRLEALEADRYDLLPGPVFPRALAASVCRNLKLDAAAVLALLPQADPHELVVDGSLNQPFRTQGHPSPGATWPAVSPPALIAAALILPAAVLIYFMPDIDFFKRAPAQTNPSGEVTEAVAAAVPASSASPVPAPFSPALAASSAAVGAPAPAALPAASAVVPAMAPVNTAPAHSAPAAEAVLFFDVQRNSWVDVTDAAGTVVLRRTLTAGEQLSVSGKPVLKVVVGNAGGVQVKVRGQALDLKALAQDNVARFEVK